MRSGMNLRPCPKEITVCGVRQVCTSTVARSWKLCAKDGESFSEDLTESTSDEELRMMVVRKISKELGPFKWHLEGSPCNSGGGSRSHSIAFEGQRPSHVSSLPG